MERFEVWSVVDGSHDSSEEFETGEDALHAAAVLADELTREVSAGTSFEVFILPHYCDSTDVEDECTCAQWLQSHHALYASEGTFGGPS